jgi:hypothetical protein
MKNLNSFAILFCIITTLTSYSQIVTGSFKINNEEVAISPLPEVLLSFEAVFDSKKVELTWSSTSEINNNFYAVEKSKDGIVFEELVSIKGFGNNSSLISYFETDYNPFDGISYYRLKQTNANGIIVSSRLVSINNIYLSNSLSLNIGDDHSANLLGSENKEVIVVLRNEKGIETYSKVIIDQEKNIIVSTDNETKLDIGTYLVIASSDNKLYSQKLVIK